MWMNNCDKCVGFTQKSKQTLPLLANIIQSRCVFDKLGIRESWCNKMVRNVNGRPMDSQSLIEQ